MSCQKNSPLLRVIINSYATYVNYVRTSPRFSGGGVIKGRNGNSPKVIHLFSQILALTYEPDMNRKITFRNERLKLMVV
jgi:hypothetical protein